MINRCAPLVLAVKPLLLYSVCYRAFILTIMSVNISKLKKSKVFENEKIKISFSTGEVSDALSVYIKDENGKNHHILWEISPDRCHQNFDKSNEKIRAFVKDKIDEWVNEEEESERLRNEAIKNRKHREENELRKLTDSF